MTKEQKIDELMRMTGKGKMACEIALSLSHCDVEKTLVRMRKTYPSMVLASPTN